mgnify:CR=1
MYHTESQEETEVGNSFDLVCTIYRTDKPIFQRGAEYLNQREQAV